MSNKDMSNKDMSNINSNNLRIRTRTESEHQSDFMDVAGQERYSLQQLIRDGHMHRTDFIRWVSLWNRLINEEVNVELRNYVNALIANPYSFDTEAKRLRLLSDIADSIIDSKYVLDGLGNLLGLPMALLFEEVHTSNMAKAQRDTSTGELLIIRRGDGKILKPEGWKAPNLEKILKEMI